MRILEINERFAQYFDKLDYGQTQQLEKSMLHDLTSEPIVWWHNAERDRDEILDGHNRYAIAKRCKLDPQFHEKHFEDEDSALLWIIRNQTTRRNLNNRERVVSLAVELEIKIGNKGKTEAVEAVADQMGISRSTAFRSLVSNDTRHTLNPVTAYKEARYSLEKNLNREKNKAVEQFKKEVIRDGLDEDAAQDKWQIIEAEIDKQHAEAIAEVESLGEQAQQAIEDNPGLRSLGQKRTVKKSVRDRAARRNTIKKALALIAKLNDVFYFWEQVLADVPIDAIRASLRAFQGELEVVQASDVKTAKKRFGR